MKLTKGYGRGSLAKGTRTQVKRGGMKVKRQQRGRQTFEEAKDNKREQISEI